MNQQQLFLNRNLQNAIIMKRADQVLFCISQGADVNAACPLNGKNTPLHTACKNIKTVPYYPDGIDIDNDDDVVAVEALIVDILLQCGADVHLRNVLYETPLHTACRYAGGPCSFSIVKLLVEKGGADLKHVHHATSFEGFTPLHLACCVSLPSSLSGPRKKQLQIVQYLIQHGAPVNARNPPPPPPPSAQSQQPSITSTITTGEKIMKTPLLVAATRDVVQGSVMQELLAAGADILATDENGRTAADVVESVSPSSVHLVEKMRNTINFVQACLDNDTKRIKALCWNCDNCFVHVSIIKPTTPTSSLLCSEEKKDGTNNYNQLAMATETLFAFVCRLEMHEAILALALRGGADYGDYNSDRSITLHWPVILVRWYLDREERIARVGGHIA